MYMIRRIWMTPESMCGQDETLCSTMAACAQEIQATVKAKVQPKTWEAFWFIAVDRGPSRNRVGPGNISCLGLQGQAASRTTAQSRGRAIQELVLIGHSKRRQTAPSRKSDHGHAFMPFRRHSPTSRVRSLEPAAFAALDDHVEDCIECRRELSGSARKQTRTIRHYRADLPTPSCRAESLVSRSNARSDVVRRVSSTWLPINGSDDRSR